MRKILSVLLAVVLAAGVCASPALAAETPTVSISSGTVAPGGDVTLTVSIRDNPGIAAMILYVYYDTSVFSMEPDKDIRASGTFASSGSLLGNTIARAKEVGRYNGDPEQDGVLAYWIDSSGLNVADDGSMMSVRFHAKSDAKEEAYEIRLGYSSVDTCNEDLGLVTLALEPGTLTVTGNGTQTNPGGSSGDNPGGVSGNNPSGSSGSTSGGQSGSNETVELFSDVAGNWAEEYITQAAERGLIVGYDGKYRPQDSMTRAELVTTLWRASGSPEAEPSAFTDLTQDWYKDAVAWAEQTGVVKGVGGGRFDPTGLVSREQLATILHRMAGSPTGMEGMLTGLYDQQFADSGELSDWAKASVYWTYFNEILCGNERLTAEGELAPQADATRAQIAVMIVRYLDRMEKGG